MDSFEEQLKQHEIWVASNPQQWAGLFRNDGPHREYVSRIGLLQNDYDRVTYPLPLIQETALAYMRCFPFQHLNREEVDELVKGAVARAIRGDMTTFGKRAEFKDEDLSEKKFHGNLSAMTFINTNMTGADASGSVLAGWNLKGCNVDDLTLSTRENPSILSLMPFDHQAAIATLQKKMDPEAAAEIQQLEAPLKKIGSRSSPHNLYKQIISSQAFWLYEIAKKEAQQTEFRRGIQPLISECEGSNLYIESTHLHDALIEKSVLPGAVFDCSRFSGWFTLSHVDLSMSSWEDSHHITSFFINSPLAESSFCGAVLDECLFDGCDLKNADISSNKKKSTHAVLTKFQNSNLNGTDFSGAELLQVHFFNIRNMATAKFDNTKFSHGAQMHYSSAKGCDFRGAVFFDKNEYPPHNDDNTLTVMDPDTLRDVRATLSEISLKKAFIDAGVVSHDPIHGITWVDDYDKPMSGVRLNKVGKISYQPTFFHRIGWGAPQLSAALDQ